MGRRFFKVLAVLASLFAFAAAPAFGADQVIDATLPGALSMTGDPTAAINGWVLQSSGSSTHSGGTMTIQSNVNYTVTLVSDKDSLTEWDPDLNGGAGGYVTGGEFLDLPVTVTASVVSGSTVTAVGLVLVPATTTGLPIASNLVGLGTDTYNLELAQATTIADVPLDPGHTYHSVFTYTAASTLP